MAPPPHTCGKMLPLACLAAVLARTCAQPSHTDPCAPTVLASACEASPTPQTSDLSLVCASGCVQGAIRCAQSPGPHENKQHFVDLEHRCAGVSGVDPAPGPSPALHPGGFIPDDFSGKGEGSSTYVCAFPGSMDWDADFREACGHDSGFFHDTATVEESGFPKVCPEACANFYVPFVNHCAANILMLSNQMAADKIHMFAAYCAPQYQGRTVTPAQ
jgi:hypothetical protein